MATPASSSLFMSLGNAWRLLTLRSDIDDIILELLGHFSLDKIYAESGKEAYQNLLITLVSQLNTIYYLQRLTLPSENLQAGSIGWYLGFLASWEVTFRSLEFVLQVVQEGRESLWEAEALRDLYLPEFILSSLRLLILHPKAPTNQRAKDRRERFARVNRSLERINDSYPGPKSFLFLLCREITTALRNEPNSLTLPTKMRYELPNLASDLYPLAECLSSQYVSTIVPQHGFAARADWLPQYLALRDVSQFLVGASIQYAVNRETRDVRLQSSSARTRNAVLHAVENLRMPEHLAQLDIAAPFSETFRVILPDVPYLDRPDAATTNSHETKMDATDALCLRLCDRMVIHRVSDREMMHSLSELSRSLTLLDDPSSTMLRPVRPRLYALNCPHAHLAGDSQLRPVLKFPDDPPDGSEIKLPPDSKCLFCGEEITAMREVSIARQTWDTLKPLEPNPDTINVERHLRTQFQLIPPKFEGMSQNTAYGSPVSRGDYSPSDPDVHSQPLSIPAYSNPYPYAPRAISQTLMTPQVSSIRQILDEHQQDLQAPDNATFNSSEGTTHSHSDGQKTFETQTVQTSIMDQPPSSGDPLVSPVTPSVSTSSYKFPRPALSPSAVSFDQHPLVHSRTAPPLSTPKTKKSGLFSGLRSKRETPPMPSEAHSNSRSAIMQETVEEISLTSLISVPKSLLRSKTAKIIRDVNVYLSQNSPHALFWSQSFIYILDIESSPPRVIQALATDSTCVQAAVTRVHLAYIVKSQDQKLTLRIANIASSQVPVVEYRMPQTPYCTSLAISPKENVVAVGFESPIVRFFSTSKSEPPREDHLHSRYHEECKEKECPPVGTLSFSNDGLTVLASVRSLKNGMILFYSWHHPFESFQEESKCRYHVALHESEDNGVTSAIYRPKSESDASLICVTTWTLAGTPLLIQTSDGQKIDIRTDRSGHYGQLGSRIQSAAFSASGNELAIVNAKGHVYHVANLDSNPLDPRRIATSLELTKKEGLFAMTCMTLPEEEAIVLAWADSSKALGYIKKIPTKSRHDSVTSSIQGHLHTTHHEAPTAIHYELSGEGVQPPQEMNAPDIEAPPYTEKAPEGLRG